jgi:putative mycofactocin binding protein MftB
MVSAVSTEPAMDTSINRQDDLRYTVPQHVRVRKEAFGLLFYNTEDARLTFVKSGDFLQIQALPNREKRIVAGLKPQTQVRVKKLLDHLSKKRLIGDS